MSSYLMDHMRTGRTVIFRGMDGSFTPHDALQARSQCRQHTCVCVSACKCGPLGLLSDLRCSGQPWALGGKLGPCCESKSGKHAKQLLRLEVLCGSAGRMCAGQPRSCRHWPAAR